MNHEKVRKQLFKDLEDSIRLSHEKLHTNRKTDQSRLGWGRLMNSLIMSYGNLLETVQLDELMKEIEAIKEHIGMKQT